MALTMVAAALARAQPVDLDAFGQPRAVVDFPRERPLHASVWVVRDGWRSVAQQWELKDRKWSRDGDVATLAARFDPGDGASAIGLTVRHDERAGKLDYTLKAAGPVPGLVGLYWAATLPAADFAGGDASLGDVRVALPNGRATPHHLIRATCDRVAVRSRDGRTSVTLTFDRPRDVVVQDARGFGVDGFQVYFPLREGDVAAGDAAAASVTIACTLPPDDAIANIAIAPDEVTHPRFGGVGGNFVYATDSPVTRRALETLGPPAWARVGMDLTAWEPTNDDADPRHFAPRTIAADSPLGRRFALDRELYDKAGGGFIASVWRLPEWLYERPVAGWRDEAGRVPRERWDELAECVASYLLHLRRTHDVEPRLFSFNESDQGVYLLLDGDELRDLTKHLGRAFEAAGLKTKLLLGDSASLANGIKQIAPTLADAEAMRFVGGLSYHVWAGEREHWTAWADAAGRAGVPLIVAEVGVDAEAWRDGSHDRPINAVRHARRYVDLIAHARADALLEWEWTGDYPLLDPTTLKPGPRHRLLWLLTQRTPPGRVVRATCDQAGVGVAAVIGDGGRYAVHLANGGDARRVRLRGLPWTTARVEASSATEDVREVAATVEGDDALTFELPAGAWATVSGRP